MVWAMVVLLWSVPFPTGYAPGALHGAVIDGGRRRAGLLVGAAHRDAARHRALAVGAFGGGAGAPAGADGVGQRPGEIGQLGVRETGDDDREAMPRPVPHLGAGVGLAPLVLHGGALVAVGHDVLVDLGAG